MHEHLNLDQLRKQAKERLLKRRATGENVKLSLIQFELAREHGFTSWPKLRAHLAQAPSTPESLAPDARAAVLDYLPLARERPKPVAPPQPRTGWAPRPRPVPGSGFRGPWFAADLATVEVLKERIINDRYFCVLGFESDGFHTLEERIRLEGVFQADPIPSGGWRAHGTPNRAEGAPRRTQPWVNLAGGSGPNGTFANGKVHPAGQDVARVRLRAPDGTELDEDADAGWVIFLSPREFGWPFTVELLDPNGTIIATQIWGTELAEATRHQRRQPPAADR